MEFLKALVSVIPIVVPFIMLVVLRKSAKFGMTVSMFLMIVGGLLVWQISYEVILGSFVIGLHKTLTILFILLGALTLVNTLKNTKAIQAINEGFTAITKDKRLLSVIIVFLFGGLIEGASGFGTPATITGPLLVSIGFNPIIAAVLALIGDSTSVSFGAVGTPLIIGLADVNVDQALVASYITFIDLFSGVFVPFMIASMYIFFTQKEGRFKQVKEVLPWTLYVGILYSLTAYLIANFVLFEITSILSPIIVLVIVSYTTMKGFLVPDFNTIESKKIDGLFTAWIPYIIVVVLLLITRLIGPLKTFLMNLDFLSINNVFGTPLSSSFSVFYSPGFILILVSIMASYIQSKNAQAFIEGVKETKGVLLGAMKALVPTLIMVTIFTSSGLSESGISMPKYIADSMSNLFGDKWSFASTYLGMIGSFISGSATVSNLTFGSIQYEIATNANLIPAIILASQVLGAAIGNMICVHNVVAASYVVGLENEEGSIIKKTVITALIYATIVTIITSLFIFLN